MGQAITTLIWRLLSRGEAAKPLLSADPHRHGDGDECAGSVRLFGRYWKSGEALIRILRRLIGGAPGKPQPADPYHHFIDIGIDPLDFETALPAAGVGVAIALVDGDQEEAASNAAGNHFGSPIREVSIRLVDVDVAQGSDDVILKSLPPAPMSSRGRLGPYSWEQKILLVGEGDFSFSRSLAVAFGDASNMVSTSLDSFEFLKKNYKRALPNILELTSKGCKVMHGVDATKMANHPQLRSLKFDCIVYNFPHAGFDGRHVPRDAQISKHQELVRGFLANAKKMIKGDGQIHITHKCVGFLREWNLEMLGTTEGLRLVEEAPFNYREYPGYNTKYGYGGDRSFNCWPSKRYKFQLLASPNN